jgi:competence protein ComEC
VRVIGTMPAIALLVGAVCGLFAGVSAALGLSSLCIIAVTAWAAWWCRQPGIAAAATTAAFFCAGATLASHAEQRALHPSFAPDAEPVAVRARLLEDASPQNGFTALRVVVVAARSDREWMPVEAGATITVGGSLAAAQSGEWRAGRVIESFATFRRPARYLNRGVPDFQHDLALAGTAWFGSIKSAAMVGVLSRGSQLEETAAVVRRRVRRSVERWVAPHNAVSAAIVTAVLIGDRTGLPDEVRLRLQAAGTYHVIAISGGNIAILTGLLLGLLLICGIGGRPAACITLLLLIAYALVVTAGASVWRATLMAALYLGARLLDHRSPAWNAMATAAAVVVCARPLDVRDAGFLLTFGATAALLEGASRVKPAAGWKVRAWLVASLVASLAVEAALLPITATTFSRVTSAGLLLNLVAVPLMALVQVGGLVVSIFADLELIALPAGWIAYAASAALVESARLVDVMPWLTARVPPPSLVLIVTYYGGLALALVGAGIARWCGAAIVLASTLAIVSGQPSGWLEDTSAPGRLRLTLFDVGQADATLVELPDSSRLLVDSGGMPFGSDSFDIGSRVLAPALWALGVRRLDTLVLTHGDPDHIGGAASVISDFAPAELWEGVPVLRHRPLQEVLDKARDAGVAVTQRLAGDEWDRGKARVRVLHPVAPDWERQRVRNDDSLVLEVVYGEVAVLLLGDVGVEVERSILPQLTQARHRILKVGHHGSRTSTSQELLDHWRPEIALISCGRGNTFGHPAPDVLGRLNSIGSRIYRTDVDGQVTIDTDGAHVSVATFIDTHD